MKRLIALLTVCLFCLGQQTLEACTSIIITGKATPDGRPLMWKHRDTGAHYNHIAYVDEDGYRFLGLVNSDEPNGAVWMGTNETGFSIMNTASYNLKDDEIKEMDQEGNVMRQALKVCRNVQDFQNFLDTLSRPMRVEANFGVIDAEGGAAYFETNNTRYYKKDANDPALAPNGYLIYTNFSFEGKPDKGLGYIRYDNATRIFKEMEKEAFTPERIFREASCSFYNSQLGIDLMDPKDSPNNRTGWFVEQDFIPRNESTASIVIQGVKPGMNPELTTMWTELGYPPLAVTLPLWVKLGKDQPSLMLYEATGKTAPLCYYATTLKEKVYSIHRGNGQKYMNWQLMWNDAGTGYIQQLRPIQSRIFQSFDAYKTEWETNGLNPAQIQQLYGEVSPLIKAAYEPLMPKK